MYAYVLGICAGICMGCMSMCWLDVCVYVWEVCVCTWYMRGYMYGMYVYVLGKCVGLCMECMCMYLLYVLLYV